MKVKLNAVVDEEVDKKIREIAEEQERSFSSTVNILLKKATKVNTAAL